MPNLRDAAEWVVKRISALTRTATDADLTDSEYMAVDNASAYTRKITVASFAMWVLGKIKGLRTTATEADLVSGNYFALDGSAGTKKLPSDILDTKKNSTENLYALADDLEEWSSYGTSVDSATVTSTTTHTEVFFERDVDESVKPNIVCKVRVLSISSSSFSLWKVSVNEDGDEATTTKIGDYVGDGDVMDIYCCVPLDAREYIGISGSFAYKAHVSYKQHYYKIQNDGTITGETAGILGVMYYGILYGAVDARFDGIDSYIDYLSKLNGFVENSGGNISLCTTSREQTLVFWPTRNDVPKVKYVTGINIYQTSDVQSVYKVKVTGTTATATKLMDVYDKSYVPLFVELADDEFIGLSGYFRYVSSGQGGNYYYNYIDGNGNVQRTNGGTIGLEIEGFPEGVHDPYNVVVASDGSGDYTTIHDAIVGTYGVDTASTPVTIKVKAGTYNEPSMSGSFGNYPIDRHLCIIGDDKVNTIVKNTNGFYYPGEQDNSCIKVSGNIYIANLTLISLTTDYQEPAGTTHHDMKRAYCIHVDSNTTGNCVVEINNCRMFNDHSCCVGIGTRKNLEVRVVDCDMESTFYEPTLAVGGAVVYAHDGDGGDVGVTNQYLTIKNCLLKSTNSNYAVKLYNAHGFSIGCTFVGNACEFNEGGDGITLGSIGELTKLCSGNNVEGMNY